MILLAPIFGMKKDIEKALITVAPESWTLITILHVLSCTNLMVDLTTGKEVL